MNRIYTWNAWLPWAGGTTASFQYLGNGQWQPLNESQIAAGAVGSAQLANGAVGNAQLAAGAAFANLYAGGQSGVASGGIVLSEQENNTNLLNAGYVKIGKVDLVAEGWQARAAGPTSISSSHARMGHTAIWTGTEMLVWGGYDGGSLNTGLRYNPAANSWSVMSRVEAPSPRFDHTAVWSGSQMIIWGGQNESSQHSFIGGRYNPVTDTWQPTSPAPWGRSQHAAVWAGNVMVVWGGTGDGVGFPGSTRPGARYNPVTDAWSGVTTNDAPSWRSSPAFVSTGTELILWGGAHHWSSQGLDGYSCPQNGGRYNPATDTWRPVTSTNAPEGRAQAGAVWTGTQMVVWGGYDVDPSLGMPREYSTSGGRYNPTTDTWTTITTNNAPVGRRHATTVWDGRRMIVWGGRDQSWNPLDSGGRYDVAANAWSGTTLASAPQARLGHSAVWSGSQMIIWGGGNNDLGVSSVTYFDSGGRYNVTNNTWSETADPAASIEPGARSRATAIWTGNEMIVWGGMSGGYPLRSGGRYDATLNSWTALSLHHGPTARYDHTAIWTGSEMIIWGGFDGDACGNGARYNPVLDFWQSLTNLAAPSPRQGHQAVWTGTEMIVWGGGYAGQTPLTGGRYHPASDSWTATSTNGAPHGRTEYSAVWTGHEMIVWGGAALDPGLIAFGDGGHYHPLTDQWTAISTNGAPAGRWAHTAVWTGQKMIIWGGQNLAGYQNTGGCYTPGQANPWSATPLSGVPQPRVEHSAVWDGSHMLVWGGQGTTSYANGARYNPIRNQWFPMTSAGAPVRRARHTAVWTGTLMVVADGDDNQTPLDTVHNYTPPRSTYLYLKP